MTRFCFIIDPSLPLGLIANTAAILSLSLGAAHPHLIGPDVTDGDGDSHAGITQVVLPVLAADADNLRALRTRATGHRAEGLMLVDVTQTAQRAKAYQDYADRLSVMNNNDIRYFGIGLHGPAGLVRSLTGHLPLMK